MNMTSTLIAAASMLVFLGAGWVAVSLLKLTGTMEMVVRMLLASFGMALFGAFYYLRVVKVMYFDEPITATTVSAPMDVRAVLSVNGALVLALGILPSPLMSACIEAIRQALTT